MPKHGRLTGQLRYILFCNFRHASHVLGDTLRSRADLISLNAVENLPELILQMSDHQLANFCRVLYFVLTDADSGEDRNTRMLLLGQV